VNVTPVNDAPGFSSSSALNSIAEDQFNNSGTLISQLVATSIVDPDAGAQKGIAVRSVDTTKGSWEYTLDGTNWFNVGAVSINNALLLPSDATTAIRFVPNPDFNGSSGLMTYRAWDQTSGSAGGYADITVSGGTTAFSSQENGTSVSVSPVNDAPVGIDNSYHCHRRHRLCTFTLSDFGFTDVENHGLLRVIFTTLPTSGNLLYAGNPITVAGSTVTRADIQAGIVTYSPATNANGNNLTSFTFQIQDDGGTANGGVDTDPSPNTITVNVSAVNDAPIFTTLNLTISEGASVVLSSSNINTIDYDNSAVELIYSASSITNGRFEYVANPNVAITSFSQADINNGLVKFVHDGSESAPNFQLIVTDGSLNGGPFSPLMNFTNVNDAPLVTAPTGPLSATEDLWLAIEGTGFSFTDVDAGTGILRMTLNVTQGYVSVGLGDSGAWIVSGNASDTVVLEGDSTALNNLITGASTGFVRYVPNVDEPNATTTFTVTVNDQGNTGIDPGLTGDESSEEHSASVLINVTAVNDAPVGIDKSIAVTEDIAYTFTLADFAFSDVENHGLLRVIFTTLPTSGNLLYAGNPITVAGSTVTRADIQSGIVTYSPATNANGNNLTSFTFQIQDDGGTANGGVDTDPSPNTITINVSPVNDAPVTTPVTLTSIAEDSGPRLITQAELLVNASDVEGDSLTATNLAISAGNGSLVDNGDGTWTYTPALNDNTSVSLSYNVTDGSLAVAGSASLDITPVNDAGTFGGDVSATTNEDTATTGTVTFVDTADGFTTPNFTINTAATNGTATINAAGNWTYTPNANFNGADSFTVQVIDDDGHVETQVIAISVTAVNDAPILNNSVTFSLTSITEDDLDNLGNTVAEILASTEGISVTDVDGPEAQQGIAIRTLDSGNGTWQYSLDGGSSWQNIGNVLNGNALLLRDIDLVRFLPNGVNGTNASFTFRAWDQTSGVAGTKVSTASGFNGGTTAISNAIGTAKIIVISVNDAPTSTPVTLSPITEDSGARLITQAELLANANDVDGPSLTATDLSISSGLGTLQDNDDGTWTYTPALNDDSEVIFSYIITDGSLSLTNTASLDITPVNDAGTFGGDVSATTNEDTATTGTVTFVDTADGFTTPNFTINTAATNGTATINAAGNWTYTPNANFNGADSFTVQVIDDDGHVETQVIAISVTAVNDAGTFGGDVSATTNEDTATTGTVTFVDTADGFTTPNFTINTAATNGTATINAAGNWTYTPIC
jgi:VCBS repeat-containing protein